MRFIEFIFPGAVVVAVAAMVIQKLNEAHRHSEHELYGQETQDIRADDTIWEEVVPDQLSREDSYFSLDAIEDDEDEGPPRSPFKTLRRIEDNGGEHGGDGGTDQGGDNNGQDGGNGSFTEVDAPSEGKNGGSMSRSNSVSHTFPSGGGQIGPQPPQPPRAANPPLPELRMIPGARNPSPQPMTKTSWFQNFMLGWK